MSDLVERLRDPRYGGLQGLCLEAADEIERLQSLLGAVTPGQSVAEIKEYLRTLHKDKADGSRESNAN